MVKNNAIARFTKTITFLLVLAFIIPNFGLRASAQSYQFETDAHVVAVGDIHGAHDAFVGLLQTTELIDSEENWIGGETHFVSLGDILDRGPDSRKSMDLLMKLQSQALNAGGYVHVVAGNHELMNVIGDLRYVSTGEYAAFAKDEETNRSIRSRRNAAFKTINFNSDVSLSEFDDMYPKGYFAHRAAFSPTGKYGKWVMSLPAIVVINETAFVHGGLPQSVSSTGLAKTNKTYSRALSEYMAVREQLIADKILPYDEKQDLTKIAKSRLSNKSLKSKQKKQLKKFIELDDSDILNSAGPVWYRGAMMCRRIFEEPILDDSLLKLGAKRVVVGHTPSRDGEVHTRYTGKLVQLDTGMLVSHYKGRPSALVITGDNLQIKYLNPKQNSSLSSELESIAVQAHPNIEAALLNGTLKATKQEIGSHSALVKISHMGDTMEGAFYPSQHELAAYKLDQLLGFDLVPPTVARAMDNRSGSLQFAHKNVFTETERVQKKISPGGWCPLPRQYQLMLAFDVLTENSSRTGDNLYYRKNQGLIFVTDFTNAFGTSKKLPSGIRDDAIELSEGMKKALSELNEANLKAELNNILSDQQIGALLARRDAMLKKFR